MEEFSVSLWNNVTTDVEKALKISPIPAVAAFDADGTLWNTDVGEAFFDYQIKNCNLKLPADPWDQYIAMKMQHPPTAYLWLAQISAGHSVAQVRQWANDWFEEIQNDFPFFESQRQLVKHLHQLKMHVYVVSASVQWSVEPAARALGIPAERVLGVRTKIKDGIVTDEVDGQVTWQEGKAAEILRSTGGVHPILCSGNTTGDLKMLELSKGCKLAISCESSIVPEAEKTLLEIAKNNQWYSHRF